MPKFHLFAILFFSVLCYTPVAFAQSGSVTAPYTNGEVRALANYGDTVLVGGNFTKVFSYEQSSERIAYFDTLNGQHIAAKLITNGDIKKIIRDENGTGFYIAGTFTTVGDSVRSGVAHIDAAGNVTARLRAWRMETPNYNDLVLRGDSLFAAGSFLNNIYPANSAASGYLKGISTLTGTNDNSNLPEVNGPIDYMVTDAMGARYICGSFTRVGNQPRNMVAKIDSLGNVLPWEPNITGAAVVTMMLRGNRIILAGRFEFVNGQTRNSIAEVDTASGKSTTALNIVANRGGLLCSIHSIDRWQNTLVLAGDFTHIGDSARLRVAVIDTLTWRATSRIIDVDPMAVKVIVSGNQLYIGGASTVNGISRSAIASINLATGALSALTISPNALSGISFVTYDILLNGTTLYVGGLTIPINGLVTNACGVVAINTGTGSIITQFTVPRNQVVYRLALHQGLLYASGNFTAMNTNPRSGLASINVSNNTLTGSFVTNTLLNETVLGGSGNRMLISATSTEEFVRFNNNQTITGMLVFHTTSDSMFTFNHQVFGQVMSLLISNDTLYMGGSFTIYGRNRGADSTRNNFAAIRLSNYDVLSPVFSGVSGTVNTLVKWNNTIILGGQFSAHPSGLVGLNIASSSLQSYIRPHTGTVNQMCLINGKLYLAGSFTLSGNAIGLISTSTNPLGSNTTWSTDYTSCSTIYFYQNRLYTFGTYLQNSISLKQIRTFALPSNPAIAPSLLTSRSMDVPTGDVFSFTDAGNRIMAAGTFTFLGSEVNAQHFFAYQRSTGKVLLTHLRFNSGAFLNTLACYGNTLYMGGGFDSIGGLARQNIASVNLQTGTVNTWNPGANSWVMALHVADSNLWAGGYFSSFAGQTRNGLSVLQLPANTLRSGVPQLSTNAIVLHIKSNANSVFIGGGFDSVGGVFISRLASFNRTSLALNSAFVPHLTSAITNGVSQMDVVGNAVYVLNQNRQLLKINTTSGLPDSVWTKPTFSSDYRSIIPYRSGLLLLGTTSLLIDTVQGNQSPLKLNGGQLSSWSPFGTRVYTGWVVGDNLICGGWFSNGIRKHLSEYGLTGNEFLRMETSQLNMCKGRNFTIRVSGADTLTTKDFVARINGNTLGIISVPSKMILTVQIPQSIPNGSFNSLTLESATTTLQASRVIITGDPASKVLQTSRSPVLCTGYNLSVFFADSTNRNSDTYKWYRNDTLILGANQYMLLGITAPGSYRSIVETPANCIDTTTSIVVSNTGLCQAPTLSAQGLKFKSISTTSAIAFWKNGNGARRIVIVKADSAVNVIPTYGTTYTASIEFGKGDSLGFKNYVVYNGTGNEALLIGLIPGKTYHIAVIEYNETGAASSYQSSPYLIGRITLPAATYYSKSTGNLNTLATWGTNTNGTGTSPTNFSTPAIFIITNNTAPALSGNWILDSLSSVVRVETFGLPGTIQCTIPAGIQVQCGNMVVSGRNVLTVSGGLNCQFATGLDTSLYIWNGSAQQLIPESQVGRLTVSGGEKRALGRITVSDTLNLNAIIRMQGDTFTLGTQFFPVGPLVRSSGFIDGPMNRWIRNIITTGTNGLLPTGRENKYMPLQFNFTSAPTGTGNVLFTAHALAAVPGNSGLPVSEGGVSIKTAGRNGFWRTANTLNRTGISFTFIAGANNYNGVNNPTTTRLIFRNPGGNWQTFGTAGVVAGNAAAFTITKTNVSLFGEFAIGADSAVNPLPVTLLSFTARRQTNNNVLLTWHTQSETNNAYFEVERSTDAHTFYAIGKVNGAGTQTNGQSYRFTDEGSADLFTTDHTLYYRLKQVDADGTYTNSFTVSVATDDHTPQWNIYPNPASTYLMFEGLSEEAVIYDLLGHARMTVSGNGIADVSTLPDGLYLIHSGGHSRKLIKRSK